MAERDEKALIAEIEALCDGGDVSVDDVERFLTSVRKTWLEEGADRLVAEGKGEEAMEVLIELHGAFDAHWNWMEDPDPSDALYKESEARWEAAIGAADFDLLRVMAWTQRLGAIGNSWPEFSYFDVEDLDADPGSDSEDESRHRDLGKKTRDWLMARLKGKVGGGDMAELVMKLTNAEAASRALHVVHKLSPAAALAVALHGVAVDNATELPSWPVRRKQDGSRIPAPANPYKIHLLQVACRELKSKGPLREDQIKCLLELRLAYEVDVVRREFTEAYLADESAAGPAGRLVLHHCDSIVQALKDDVELSGNAEA